MRRRRLGGQRGGGVPHALPGRTKLEEGNEGNREEWELRNQTFHEVLISASPSAGAALPEHPVPPVGALPAPVAVPASPSAATWSRRAPGHRRCRVGPRDAGGDEHPHRAHPAHSKPCAFRPTILVLNTRSAAVASVLERQNKHDNGTKPFRFTTTNLRNDGQEALVELAVVVEDAGADLVPGPGDGLVVGIGVVAAAEGSKRLPDGSKA